MALRSRPFALVGLFASSFLTFLPAQALAQGAGGVAPPPFAPVNVLGAPSTIPVAEPFEALHFRSIGPAVMSGRISDLAVYHANPALYYVATAHGGVWKTTNHGTTWEPLFQDEGLISIGDVQISQRNPDLLWVGAGESNNRQSTSWGGGVYKSTDGGESFRHMGLARSEHIQNIVLHPENEDLVWVAAMGPLFASGGDRGIYRSTNGGESWTRVLHVDDDTGANELVMAPSNPNILFASTYQRRRSVFGMNGGGPGSGVWKSVDGGVTWSRVQGGGFPDGPLGRISMDIWARDANVVMATVEGPSGTTVGGIYRSEDGGATWEQMSRTNPRPMYFSKIVMDAQDSDRVYMAGVGLHMSLDGGRSWEPDAAQAIHDDIHAIWVNPSNANHVLIGTDGGMAVSWDQSRTWQFIPNLPVGLFYHVSYDFERPFNVCGGMQDNYNWCGPSATRFVRGILNSDWFQVLGGDGFHAIPDPRDSRIVYTESQNGNMIRRNTVTGESKNIRPTPQNVANHLAGESYRWPWDTPILLSPHDPGVLMVSANAVFRSTDRGDSWTRISPDLTAQTNRNESVMMGVRNADVRIARNDGVSSWPALISLAESPAQAGIIWTGSDDGVVSVTRDGGVNWTNVTSRIPGFPAGGYVSEVVPSRFRPGTAYVTVDNHWNGDLGTYLWITDDFGQTFRSMKGNLDGENVRTLTEDLRNGDVLYIGTETGLFVSLDRGARWERLRSNLPTVRIDEITIHPRDNAMIVATHGRALFVLDHLEPIQGFAAAQASPRATLFSVPDALQWRTKDHLNEEFWGHQWFIGENPPVDAFMQYYLPRQASEVRLAITNAAGRPVRELVASANRRTPGIQTVCWDLRVEPIPAASAGGGGGGGAGGGGGGAGGAQAGRAQIPGVPSPLPRPGYLPRNPCAGGVAGGGTVGPHVVPGVYTVALMVDGETVGTQSFTVHMDPEVTLVGGARVAWNELTEGLHEAQRQGTAMAGTLTALGQAIATAAASVQASTNLPAEARQALQTLEGEFNQVRTALGVAAPGGGGGGGGAQANALAQVGTVKTGILAFWETPSETLVQQAAEARSALDAALRAAESLLQTAERTSATLGQNGIVLTVPRGQ